MTAKGVLMRIKGYLTREEIKLLEEASLRKFRPKTPAQKYICGSCNYKWLYKAAKCPVCSSLETNKA